MDQPLGPRLSRLPGDVQGSVPVDRLKCRLAFLNLVADSIDDRSRLLDRPGNR